MADGAPPAKRRRTLPPGDCAADHLEHVFIPFPLCGTVIKNLFGNDKVVFIRAGVAMGKSTIVKYLGATSTDFIVVEYAGGNVWARQLVKMANEKLGTKISEGDESGVAKVMEAATKSGKILVFDEAHTIFSSHRLVDELLKAVVRPRMLFLSATSQAHSPEGALLSTPPEVRRKYLAGFAWPSVSEHRALPSPAAVETATVPALREQLIEADVQLTTEAIEFFARFCGGIRGIFIEAMRWVQTQQLAKPGEWDLDHAVAATRRSCGQQQWDGGLLQALVASRAIKANGKFSDVHSIPKEFVKVLVGGPSSDLLPVIKKELTVGGLLLPERAGACDKEASWSDAFQQREFLPYNWDTYDTKFGVANYLMVAYYRYVLRKVRNLQVRVQPNSFTPVSCADLLVKALPYMGFQCVVAPCLEVQGQLHSSLSATGLPCEPHYSGAAVGVLRELGYDSGSSENPTLGKPDLLVTVGTVSHCLEWIMAVKSPAEHELHRDRFDNVEQVAYSGASSKAIVTVGNDWQTVMKRVRCTRSNGVQVIGVVANAAHDSYLVIVKAADSAEDIQGPFFVECDCVARSLKQNAAGKFELACCQDLIDRDDPGVASSSDVDTAKRQFNLALAWQEAAQKTLEFAMQDWETARKEANEAQVKEAEAKVRDAEAKVREAKAEVKEEKAEFERVAAKQ